MIATVLYGIAAIALVLMFLALLHVFAFAWTTLLIIAVISGIAGYVIGGGRFVR
jgi:hypothetical protein